MTTARNIAARSLTACQSDLEESTFGYGSFPGVLEKWWLKQSSGLAHFNIWQISSCFVPIRNAFHHSQMIGFLTWACNQDRDMEMCLHTFSSMHPARTLGWVSPGLSPLPFFSFPALVLLCWVPHKARGNSFFNIFNSAFTPRHSRGILQVCALTSSGRA